MWDTEVLPSPAQKSNEKRRDDFPTAEDAIKEDPCAVRICYKRVVLLYGGPYFAEKALPIVRTTEQELNARLSILPVALLPRIRIAPFLSYKRERIHNDVAPVA